MSIVTSIFSALGNNSSLYPIIFKDSIDNAGRTIMAYNEGSKNGQKYGTYDARERFIEENGTSLVWIGGIPLIKLLYDKLLTNKIYKFSKIPELGTTFDKQGSRVVADTNLKLVGNGYQSLQKNVDKIRGAAENNKVLKNIVENADKILKKPDKFKNNYAVKMAISSLVPLTIIGFVMPKLIQKLTKSIYRDDHELRKPKQKRAMPETKTPEVFVAFSGNNKKENTNTPSFKGGLSNLAVDFFNNNVSNQVLMDVGITSGRIITGVNTADKVEKGIKEAGVVFFIYLGGRIVGGFLEKIAKKIGMPISLDSKILEDKNFQKGIVDIAKASPDKQKKLVSDILKFTKTKDGSFKSIFKAESQNADFKKLGLIKKIKAVKTKLADIAAANEKSVVDFVDNQVVKGVKNNEFQNATLKAAQKLGMVDLIQGVRNPFKFLETGSLKNLHGSISEFVQTALSKGSAENVEKFIKKALITKRASIVVNLAICTAVTAYILPKLQYRFREKFTNSSNLPALATYEEQFEKENQQKKSA